MTKSEVAQEYSLDAQGCIADLGKFEGEPWQTVALWDCALNGDGEGIFPSTDEPEDLCEGTVFELTAEEQNELGLGRFVGIAYSEQGFVSLVEFTEQEYRKLVEG
jgi:hypothetical protein